MVHQILIIATDSVLALFDVVFEHEFLESLMAFPFVRKKTKRQIFYTVFP